MFKFGGTNGKNGNHQNNSPLIDLQQVEKSIEPPLADTRRSKAST